MGSRSKGDSIMTKEKELEAENKRLRQKVKKATTKIG